MARQHRNPGLRRQYFDQLLKLNEGPICQGCFWWFDDHEDLEVDHQHPKSAGGEDTLGNLTLLCSRCNKIKSNKLALPGLQDQLKNDPAAMPQSSDMNTTKYVVNGRVFSAGLKPTKALRDLLDDVSSTSESIGRVAGFSDALEKASSALQNLRPLDETPATKVAPMVRQTGWVSLDDDEFDPTSLKPSLLRVYDGTVENIDSWREVIRKNAIKLVEDGKLVASDCPIATGERANTSVVNTEPRHHGGAKSADSDWADIGGGIWCWYTRNATGILDRTRTLLRTCGVDVGAVQFQLSQD